MHTIFGEVVGGGISRTTKDRSDDFLLLGPLFVESAIGRKLSPLEQAVRTPPWFHLLIKFSSACKGGGEGGGTPLRITFIKQLGRPQALCNSPPSPPPTNRECDAG